MSFYDLKTIVLYQNNCLINHTIPQNAKYFAKYSTTSICLSIYLSLSLYLYLSISISLSLSLYLSLSLSLSLYIKICYIYIIFIIILKRENKNYKFTLFKVSRLLDHPVMNVKKLFHYVKKFQNNISS